MNKTDISNNYATSIIIDLENLQKNYSNLLIKYKKAVSDYINYLNIESQSPCIDYNANSKNINQKCYNYIWEKAGCKTTGVADASSSWAQSQTLNGLIYNSFIWATSTENKYRQGCYGTSTEYSKATEPNYNINEPPLTTIQEMAYMGTGSAGESSATSLQECKAECSSSPNCTGATFVSGKCNIRIGDSPIIPSSKDSYAIIPQGKLLLMNINDLNSQLLNVNKEILNKTKMGKPVYNDYEYENDVKSQELVKNYKELENERENIKKLLEEYESLDTTENENQIKITKNYYIYILLFIIAIVIVVLLVKITTTGTVATASNAPVVQYGGDLDTKAYYFLFAIILLVVGINYVIKLFPHYKN